MSLGGFSMKLKNIFIASGAGLALSFSVITFSGAFKKETEKADASYAASNHVLVNATPLQDGKYYYNDGSDTATAGDYNYYYDHTTGVLHLNNYDRSTIGCDATSGDLFTIEATGTNKISREDYKAHGYSMIKSTIPLLIKGDGTIDISAKSDINAEASVNIYGINVTSGSLRITESVEISIDISKAKAKHKGISTKEDFSLEDDASLEILTASYAGYSGYSIYTEDGDMSFDSTGTTRIVVGASQSSWSDYGIYNDSNSGSHGTGSISFTGSGHVELTNTGDGESSAIVAYANDRNSQILFDGCDVEINYFGTSIFSRGLARTPDPDYDIVLQNNAKVEINAQYYEDSYGFISKRNGICVADSDLYVKINGKPFELRDDNGSGYSNSSLGFDVSGASHVDFIVMGSDDYVRSNATLCHDFDLTGDGYFNYQKESGGFPDTSIDDFFVRLGSSTRLPYASYMTAYSSNAGGGSHYSCSYSVPYRIEAFTAPSLSATVSVNGHTLTAEHPCYENEAADPSAYADTYNAWYEFSTGILHLRGYEGGAISLSDSTAGSLFRVVLEGNATITFAASQSSTAYGLNIGGNASLEVSTSNTLTRDLRINVTNDQGDVTGLGTANGFVRFTGYTYASIRAQSLDTSNAREVKGINANYVGGGNGTVSFEGHSYGYINVSGDEVAPISSCISANAGKVIFNTQSTNEMQFIADNITTGDTYVLWTSSGVTFQNYGVLYLSWKATTSACGPTYPSGQLDLITNGAVNVSNHEATITYGTAYHIDVINGSCDRAQGNYTELVTAHLTAGSIGGVDFSRWEITSGDGLFVNDSQTSRNGQMTILGNATIEAIFDFVDVAPFFDTRGPEVADDGYLHFKFKGTPTLVNIVSADRSSVIYSSNVTTNIQWTPGTLAPGTYRLRAKYESGLNTYYLDTGTFEVNYNAPAVDYNYVLKSGDGEGEDIVQITHGNVTLPQFAATGFTEPYGYQFESWGGYAPGSILSITDDLTLTAVYSPRTACTISFSAGEGTGSKDPVNSYVGYTYTLPSTAEECGFVAPQYQQLHHWTVNGVIRSLGDTIDLNVAAYTVVAIYHPIPCLVTFSHGEGTGSMDPAYYNMGQTFNLPTELENEFVAPAHKQFKGWSINDVEYAPGAEYTILEDVTITAVFESIMKTVTFDANGGSGTMAPVQVAEASSYTLPECTFTAPEGKEFDGWEIGEVKHAAGESVTIDVDTAIKALWKDKAVEPDTPVTPDSGSDSTTPTKKGLSAGAIVAIVVPSVIVAGVGGFALVWFVFLKKSWADFVAIFSKK